MNREQFVIKMLGPDAWHPRMMSSGGILLANAEVEPYEDELVVSDIIGNHTDPLRKLIFDRINSMISNVVPVCNHDKIQYHEGPTDSIDTSHQGTIFSWKLEEEHPNG